MVRELGRMLGRSRRGLWCIGADGRGFRRVPCRVRSPGKMSSRRPAGDMEKGDVLGVDGMVVLAY